MVPVVTQQVIVIAEALIRRGTDVLLVEQQKFGDPEPYWTLPGGLLEPGEQANEAAARETLEETGVTMRDPGRLAYISQHDSLSRGEQVMVLCFETFDWIGEVVCEDPGGVVSDARFFSVSKAIDALERIFLVRRDARVEDTNPSGRSSPQRNRPRHSLAPS